MANRPDCSNEANCDAMHVNSILSSGYLDASAKQPEQKHGEYLDTFMMIASYYANSTNIANPLVMADPKYLSAVSSYKNNYFHKHPDKIPIMVTCGFDKNKICKFLVPKDTSMTGLIDLIRSTYKLKSSEALYTIATTSENDFILTAQNSLQNAHKKYRDINNILHIIVQKENVYG